MKTKILILIILFCTITSGAQNTKHVFWYKCIQNNYNLTDSSGGKGPNIQGDVIKHEGKALTGSIRYNAGSQDPTITFGNGSSSPQGRSFVFWFNDLCNFQLGSGATLISAKFRGEYRDNWNGIANCNEGLIQSRVGVVLMDGHFSSLGVTPVTHPDNVDWKDPLNLLSYTMGYEKNDSTFLAEEIKNLIIPKGNDGKNKLPLEGKFFEMDITKQAQYILSQKGLHGIAAVVNPDDGNTGKMFLYAFEDGLISDATLYPWTKDGNTTHLVLEVANGTLLPKEENSTESFSALTNKLTLSAQPNPFNSSTQIVYNCGKENGGRLNIYSIDGKLSYSKYVRGNGKWILNSAGKSNGVYICKLTTKSGQLTEQLFLRK